MKSKYRVALIMTCFVFASGNKSLSQGVAPVHHIDSFQPASPSGLLDLVIDNLGKRYTLAELSIEDRVRANATNDYSLTTPSSCSSGYFQLYLESGCGMDGTDAVSVARLNVLCRVLYDISQFINSPCTTTGQKVNIWVKKYSGISVPGTGTPFYNVPYSTTQSGIADNAAWVTINSGTDAYKNVAAPLAVSGGGSSGSSYFHGAIRFDFSGAIIWHTDLSTPPAAGEFDLYTCALHEMMHTLGIGTLIDYDGQSVLGSGYQYYTRYDQHLQTAAGLHLISDTSSCTQLFQNTFNSLLTPSTILSPGGWVGGCAGGFTSTLTDSTRCATAITYSGATNVKVYTPQCFEKGSSLSHFEDQCYTPPSWFTSMYPLATYNNQYFTMSNSGPLGPFSATNPGAMKRYLKPEERLILCDLGYSVSSTFGTSANLNNYDYGGSTCPGNGVAGINDGLSAAGTFLYTSTGGPIAISEAALLANDHGVTGGSVSCIEVVNGIGTVSVSGGIVTYTPSVSGYSDFGTKLLRYIPRNAAGVEGNITYVYVYVGDGSCTPSACNIVSNGDFENTDAAMYGADLPGVHCWVEACGSPDLYTRGATDPSYSIPASALFNVYPDVHPLSVVPNDHFVGLFCGYTLSTTPPYYSEMPENALSATLDSGLKYTVSMWVRVADRAIPPYLSTHVALAVATAYPVVFPYPGIPTGLINLCDFSIPWDSSWHFYSKEITYTGPPVQTLVVMGAPWLNPDTGLYAGEYNHYIAIDDISITPKESSCSFTLADTMCLGSGPVNLTAVVGIPNGIFNWLRDSSGIAVITRDSTFDPVTAYNASLLQGDTGLVTISYTYTNPLGCNNTVFAQTHILPTTISAITGIANVHVSGTSALTDASTGGTWRSDNISIASVGSATGIVSGNSIGTTVISYSQPSGCFATRQVTVNLGMDVVEYTSVYKCGFEVTPNPNDGNFMLTGNLGTDKTQAATIEIVTELGNVVAIRYAVVSNGLIKEKIAMKPGIPTGIYFVKIVTDESSSVMRFILKE